MGPVERGLKKDLAKLPEEMRTGGVAAVAVHLARQMDDPNVDLSPRDRQGHAREIRLALVTLREQAPGDVEGDETDDARKRRDSRLRAVGE